MSKAKKQVDEKEKEDAVEKAFMEVENAFGCNENSDETMLGETLGGAPKLKSP